MVHYDYIAQWLMGNDLKQDQFNFFFETTKIVYESVCREKLLQGDEVVLDSILPKLIAFKAIMQIRNIDLKREKEHK